MKLEATVGNPNEEILIQAGYEDFFDELMSLVNNHEMGNTLGEALKSLALSFASRYNLEAFNVDKQNPYERSYIGKHPSGWEAIIMTWRKPRQSSIHAHPQFAAYNILSGKLKLEVFEDTSGKGDLQLIKTLTIVENTGYFAIGEPNTLSNHIHRITCLSDISYSLHIYSDDARKGFTYQI